MIVYIDEKVVTWKRYTYEVSDDLSEEEIVSVLKDEYEYLYCENADTFKFIESTYLSDFEEPFYNGIDMSKEMIIENGYKTIKQTI